MSLISGLGALTYPLTSALSAASAAKTKVGDLFQNVLQNQTGTQPASLTQAAAPATKSTADEFKDYMAMSPAEKMRYSIMNDLGITQKQLDAMPPEQRAAIEKKIEDLMKLRQELQNANNGGSGQQTQAAMNVSLLKQIQAGQKPQASIDTYS